VADGTNVAAAACIEERFGVTEVVARPLRASRVITVRIGAVLTVLACAAAVLLDPSVSPAAGVAVAALVPAALVDIDEGRLPDRLVGRAALATSAAAVAGLLWPTVFGPEPRLGQIGVGIGLMAAPLLVMHLVSPAAMGFGDVKAALVLGAGLGAVDPQLSLVALFVASLATAVVGLAARRRSLPFGPGLVAGSAVALCVNGALRGVTG
jgi:leader peptidase (prepilin peptidase)/N-methyltransferase